MKSIIMCTQIMYSICFSTDNKYYLFIALRSIRRYCYLYVVNNKCIQYVMKAINSVSCAYQRMFYVTKVYLKIVYVQ